MLHEIRQEGVLSRSVELLNGGCDKRHTIDYPDAIDFGHEEQGHEPERQEDIAHDHDALAVPAVHKNASRSAQRAHFGMRSAMRMMLVARTE